MLELGKKFLADERVRFLAADRFTPTINVVINYIGHKYFSFKRKAVEPDPSAEI